MNLWTEQECQGPPSVFVQFPFFNYNSNPLTTPDPYEAFNSISQIGNCGYNSVPIVDQKSCCVNSLYTANGPNDTIMAKFEGFTSASYVISDLIFANSFPASGNGFSYCALQSTTPGALVPTGAASNLYSFYKLYILAGSNISSMSCLPSGYLRIGDYAAESASTEYYQLGKASQLYISQHEGKFTGSFNKMDGGVAQIKWIQFSPHSLLHPTFYVNYILIFRILGKFFLCFAVFCTLSLSFLPSFSF